MQSRGRGRGGIHGSDTVHISRAFKAYDVRGRIPDELNAQLARIDRMGVRAADPARGKWPSVTTSG